MKKLLLTTLAVLFGLSVFSQASQTKRTLNSAKHNVVEKRVYPFAVKNQTNMLLQPRYSSVASPLSATEATIGETRYDLQSNQATENRLYMFPDGTIGGVWTMGMSEPNFPDRGTGYNYFDGTDWGPNPTARIETIRTGWPSYAPYGANGEMVVSHTDVAGLAIAKRDQKGSGSWTQSILAGPAGAVDISWPRVVTNGTGHENIHILACTYVPYQGLDQALLYYRSQDGGTSWDKQHVILPGMASTDYSTIGGDSYAWADPKNNTLAFVVGDNWMDLFLMKSTDNGENWTKTVIFRHPYPLFKENTTLVLDTPSVCDGSVSVFIDNDGNANVFFGIMRVLNSDLTDNQTSYFPYTDGLGFWKEGMPTMTDLSYDALEANNQIVGYTQDINGNDTILEFDGLGTYFLSVTSMPNATIDWADRIFLVMTSVVEGLTNGSQNYRHIYARMSEDGGSTWTGFIDVTGSIVHNFTECVSPSVSPLTDYNVHILFQMDEEPGLAVRGDTDPYGDNYIVHSVLPKSDLGIGINKHDQSSLIMSSYPNPATDKATILVTLTKPVTLSMQLQDLAGRLILKEVKGNCQSGTHYFTVDCSTIPAGIYFYTVLAGDKKGSGKIMVQ